LGLLLTSPALAACHAAGSATCYNSDKISVFFSPFSPSLSFDEILDISLVASLVLFIKLQETVVKAKQWGKVGKEMEIKWTGKREIACKKARCHTQRMTLHKCGTDASSCVRGL